MARRWRSGGSHASSGRYAYTRRFDDSIEQLTAEAIQASLAEIERALGRRFGKEHLPQEPDSASAAIETPLV